MYLLPLYIYLIGLLFKQFKSETICTTPQGLNGTCIPFIQCEPLLAILLKKPISKANDNFLRRSVCGFENVLPKACCPSNGAPLPTEKSTVVEGPTEATNSIRDISNDLLPGFNICGIDTTSRIYGGENTDLDEFPWLALIKYVDGSKESFNCGATLISNKYLLTAAHCVDAKIRKKYEIKAVRLGEFDIDINPDCISHLMGQDCAPSPIDLDIEEILIHENFNSSNFYENDIALLRLKEEATFSDFIRPICLPINSRERKKTYVQQRLYVAGWGSTENRKRSRIKKKVILPVWDLENCTAAYSIHHTKIKLSFNQMCAGGEIGKDSCRGDSGGPLMTVGLDKNKEAHWYIAGIVSYGPFICGSYNTPGVYTRVSKYVDWIVDKMKP